MNLKSLIEYWVFPWALLGIAISGGQALAQDNQSQSGTSQSDSNTASQGSGESEEEAKTIDQLKIEQEQEDQGGGFTLMSDLYSSAKWLRQKYTEPTSSNPKPPIEFDDQYNLQQNHVFDPRLDLHGRYSKNFFSDKFTSSVNFLLRTNFRGLEDYKIPPSLGLRVYPIYYITPGLSLPLDSIGLNEKTLPLGSLIFWTRLGVVKQLDDKVEFENWDIGARALALHTFNPLGAVPVFWKTLNFSGSATNILSAAYNLKEYDKPFAFKPTQRLSLSLSQTYKNNYFQASINNKIDLDSIYADKLVDKLFDVKKSGFSMIQYLSLYHQYLPLRLGNEFLLYRMPASGNDFDKHFKTHGFSIAYALIHTL